MPNKKHAVKKSEKRNNYNLYFSNPNMDIIYIDMETVTDKKNDPYRYTRT